MELSITHIHMRRKEKKVDWLMSCAQSKDDAKRTLSFYFGLSISSKDCNSNYDLQFSPVSSKYQCVNVQPDPQTVNPIVSSRSVIVFERTRCSSCSIDDVSLFFGNITLAPTPTDRSTMRINSRHRMLVNDRRFKVIDLSLFVLATLKSVDSLFSHT